jgi:hypothetical protein
VSGKWVRGGERTAGRREGVLVELRSFELHGTPYFAVIYRLDGEEQSREARLSHDMIYINPQPGDRVRVEMVLNVVDRISKAAP